MFDIELINFNPGAPSFMVMLITALFSFFLSAVIAVTYELTTKSIYRRAHFLQSLTLIGLVASTILQAIGESVAVGLGIIGALSIIRFRTALNDPRNMTFMFASLGAGIASGVMGYGIALTGTIVFCLGAFILRYSPLGNNNELIGVLKLRTLKDDQLQVYIEKCLSKYCRDFELDRYRFVNPKKITSVAESEEGISAEPTQQEVVQERLQEFVYLISLKNNASVMNLEQALNEVDGLEKLELDFKKQPTKL